MYMYLDMYHLTLYNIYAFDDTETIFVLLISLNLCHASVVYQIVLATYLANYDNNDNLRCSIYLALSDKNYRCSC
jgi:hypothetical protein